MILRIVFAILVLSAQVGYPASLEAEENPEILVEVERNQVYEGESFLYQITVKNVKDPPEPILGELKECLVEYLGESSQNQRSVSIVNGRVTQNEIYGMAFRYRLTPLKKGFLTVPAPKVEVDGEELTGRSVTVKVIGPEEQDIVVLEVSADRETVFPLLPFTITLKICVKTLPAPYSDQSPLTVQRSQPALTIPWVKDLPPGLTPARHWREWLGPIERRSGFFSQPEGFTINRIASFFPTDPSIYLPRHRRTRRPDGKGGEAEYWEYTLTREFIAKKTGDFHFGPATLKGVFGTTWNRAAGLSGENIYAKSGIVTVTVKDAPSEGRPAEYTGAIGIFDLTASIAPAAARVGDPITLTLRLKGKGTLDMAQAPDLEAIPEIGENFKVYEATVETKGNVRIFTYSLRPKRADIARFPPVPLAYFDVDRDRYVTLKTDPIPLKIQDADQLTDEDIVTQGQKGDEGEKRIEARKEGLFANIADLDALKNEKSRVDLGILGLKLAGMIFIYMLAAFLRSFHLKRTGDPALMRRRSAAGRARSRLSEGLARIREGDIRKGTDHVRGTVAGLVADAADLPEGGITPRDVKDKLESFDVDPALVDKSIRLMEACDAAQFGASESDAERLASECGAVLNSLLAALKKGGRLR